MEPHRQAIVMVENKLSEKRRSLGDSLSRIASEQRLVDSLKEDIEGLQESLKVLKG